MNSDLPDDVLRIIFGRFSDIFSLVRFELAFRGARSIAWDQIERIDGSIIPLRTGLRNFAAALGFLQSRLPHLSGSLRELELPNSRFSDISIPLDAPFPRMHNLELPRDLEFELSTVVNRNIIRRIFIVDNDLDIEGYVANFQRLFSAELPNLETLGLDNCTGISSLFPFIAKTATNLKELHLSQPFWRAESFSELLQGLTGLAPSLPQLRRIKLRRAMWYNLEQPLEQTNSQVLLPLLRALIDDGDMEWYTSNLANKSDTSEFLKHARLCHPKIFSVPDDRDMKDFVKTMLGHINASESDYILDQYGILALTALRRYKWFPDGSRTLPPWYHTFLTTSLYNLPDLKSVHPSYPIGADEKCIRLLLAKSQRPLNHVLAAGRKNSEFFFDRFLYRIESIFKWIDCGKIHVDINEKLHPVFIEDPLSDNYRIPSPNELEFADLNYSGYSHALCYAIKSNTFPLLIARNHRCNFASPILPPPSPINEPLSPGQSKICSFFRLNKEDPCVCHLDGYHLVKRSTQPLAVHILQAIDCVDPNDDMMEKFCDEDEENVGSVTYTLLDLLNMDENVMEQVQPRGNLVRVLLANPELAQRLGYESTSHLPDMVRRPQPRAELLKNSFREFLLGKASLRS